MQQVPCQKKKKEKKSLILLPLNFEYRYSIIPLCGCFDMQQINVVLSLSMQPMYNLNLLIYVLQIHWNQPQEWHLLYGIYLKQPYYALMLYVFYMKKGFQLKVSIFFFFRMTQCVNIQKSCYCFQVHMCKVFYSKSNFIFHIFHLQLVGE